VGHRVLFSGDPQQKFIYMTDGGNHAVRIILRETMEELTAFGTGGQQAGQFNGPHNIATDSKGNIYIAETFGTRSQRFVYKGLGPIRAKEQGAPWPTTTRSGQ
jgi:hypothetical protein